MKFILDLTIIELFNKLMCILFHGYHKVNPLTKSGRYCFRCKYYGYMFGECLRYSFATKHAICDTFEER